MNSRRNFLMMIVKLDFYWYICRYVTYDISNQTEDWCFYLKQTDLLSAVNVKCRTEAFLPKRRSKVDIFKAPFLTRVKTTAYFYVCAIYLRIFIRRSLKIVTWELYFSKKKTLVFYWSWFTVFNSNSKVISLHSVPLSKVSMVYLSVYL